MIVRASIQAAVVAVAVLAAAAIVPPVAGAAGRDEAVRTHTEAQLVPCCGEPEAGARGRATHVTVSRGGLVQRDRFQVRIHVPLSSASVGSADDAQARAADLRIVLSRGREYAECTLGLLGIDSEEEGGLVVRTAEYGVDVVRVLRRSAYIVKSRVGACEVDTGDAVLEAAFPPVETTDEAWVLRVEETGQLRILQGSFGNAVRQSHD